MLDPCPGCFWGEMVKGEAALKTTLSRPTDGGICTFSPFSRGREEGSWRSGGHSRASDLETSPGTALTPLLQDHYLSGDRQITLCQGCRVPMGPL